MPALDDKLTTPLHYFLRWEQERGDEVMTRQPYGDTWTELTYKEAGVICRKMANAFRTLGLEQGSHIALMSKNCYHWVLSDIAIMMAGCVSVPLYPSLNDKKLASVLEKSDSDAIIVGKLDSWNDKKGGIPESIPVIRFPHYQGNAKIDIGHDWDELVNAHEPIAEVHSPTLDEDWTIIFTSGTTGTPKGVVHTYRSPAAVSRNEELHDTLHFFSTPRTRFFSFLPLNHIAERTAVWCGTLMSGGSIAFAESLDTFAKNLQEVKPTFFFAVPRIWQKFQQKVLAKMPQKKLDRMLSIPFVSGMVKKKIRTNLGLTDARTLITGASMTPEPLKQWYKKIGLTIREAYAMTENMGAFSAYPSGAGKPNTVGKPLPNCECRIDPETSEILMKTPWTMKGYYKDDELTAECIQDGWLHSGDKGVLDDDGYLRIIGRVKDAFKTAKGKFIVPTQIEEQFASNEYIDQICVAGLGIPQPVALVNLSELCQDREKNQLQEALRASLESVNSNLPGHEKLSALVVTKDAWTDQNNLLTPTLKIKRGEINDRYGARME
ncbi:MAG: AMP-binding protein, partial [Bacteroidota bacterium]